MLSENKRTVINHEEISVLSENKTIVINHEEISSIMNNYTVTIEHLTLIHDKLNHSEPDVSKF